MDFQVLRHLKRAGEGPDPGKFVCDLLIIVETGGLKVRIDDHRDEPILEINKGIIELNLQLAFRRHLVRPVYGPVASAQILPVRAAPGGSLRFRKIVEVGLPCRDIESIFKV